VKWIHFHRITDQGDIKVRWTGVGVFLLGFTSIHLLVRAAAHWAQDYDDLLDFGDYVSATALSIALALYGIWNVVRDNHD
jgi:hypothetical protein